MLLRTAQEEHNTGFLTNIRLEWNNFTRYKRSSLFVQSDSQGKNDS